MPRPTRHEPDALLDAAAEILASQGSAAVTMKSVSRATGAPSGSLYHRFPTRAVLCGALWMRTEERFHDSLMAVLDGPGAPQERCIAAARHVVRWCRDHPIDAQVLLVGADALDAADWPVEFTARRKLLRRRLDGVLDEVPADRLRVNAAMIDIPYAIVRRHLRARAVIPDAAESIVTDCARALLSPTD